MLGSFVWMGIRRSATEVSSFMAAKDTDTDYLVVVTIYVHMRIIIIMFRSRIVGKPTG